MKLDTAPQNTAVLSNVGAINSFAIKATAKSFSILSSGLYANKIKAIVRELSTNAYDAHVAAGNQTTPFTVHLPTRFEPWFSIRDYGTGLTSDEVTSIYTTYFESTKTGSNDYVGALGLGSKSPFSYTDNFTVTAYKNGISGIYSAFIGDNGVPCIATMSQAESTEPAGVEIKFGVTDTADFNKFAYEAAVVYSFFDVVPTVTGVSNFKPNRTDYSSKDIVPGVHQMKCSNGYNTPSIAVMGNIAYPINIPNSLVDDPSITRLLNCGLVLNFAIGELDFQASREGLSYVPQTINAIVDKVNKLKVGLHAVLTTEANATSNLWTRAQFLYDKVGSTMWETAAREYVRTTNFPLANDRQVGTSIRSFIKNMQITVDELAAEYNIAITAMSKSYSYSTLTTVRPTERYSDSKYVKYHAFDAGYVNTYFIQNDTNIGIGERVKFHFGVPPALTNGLRVFIMNAHDKKQPMKVAEFMAFLHNPTNVLKASALRAKPREVTTRQNVSIIKLVPDVKTNWRSAGDDYTWRDAGELGNFSATETHYYVPLSGYALESNYGDYDVKTLVSAISKCGVKFGVGTVYGVRKADIDIVKKKANWVNVEDHIAATLNSSAVSSTYIEQMARDIFNTTCPNAAVRLKPDFINHIADKNSPFIALIPMLTDRQKKDYHETANSARVLKGLSNRYGDKMHKAAEKQAGAIAHTATEAYKRYPMVQYAVYSITDAALADYVNMVDAVLPTRTTNIGTVAPKKRSKKSMLVSTTA